MTNNTIIITISGGDRYCSIEVLLHCAFLVVFPWHPAPPFFLLSYCSVGTCASHERLSTCIQLPRPILYRNYDSSAWLGNFHKKTTRTRMIFCFVVASCMALFPTNERPPPLSQGFMPSPPVPYFLEFLSRIGFSTPTATTAQRL